MADRTAKTKWVAFKGASLVPGHVLGKEADQRMQPGKPVNLPAAYADHVVSDGFAAYCDAPKKPAAAKKKADEDKAAAEKALSDAELVLDGLEEGADGYAAAEAAVEAARADLAKLPG